jgi:hypothetical protein
LFVCSFVSFVRLFGAAAKERALLFY